MLDLEAGEIDLLGVLFEQTERALREPEDVDPGILRRLYPDAYPDDPDASAQFRELTRTTDERRVARLQECRAQLGPQPPEHGGPVDLRDPEVMQRWIQAINDVRLVVGTRVGVSAEDDHHERELDPTDPEDQLWVFYHWLTALQDTLVTSVLR